MVDLEGLRRDRDLLWAEALHRYRAGEQWWLTDENVVADAIKQQADRYESHPWQEVIERWLEAEDRESVTTSEILERCIGKPKDRWEHRDKSRSAPA
jgi:predicted P-loop ATPase